MLMKLPVVFACMTACTLAGPAAATRAAEPSPCAPADAVVETAMTRAHIPGVAVAIVRNGEIVCVRGYGQSNLEWPSPVSPDTVFQTASSTKLYTGALLMRLVQQGRLGLDEPVSNYVPDAPSAWRGLTIRHLATHTTGLAPQDVDPVLVSTEDAVRQAFSSPFLAEPGEVSRYGSWDFTILQYILEQISGKPFADLVASEMFEPLRMTSSRFDRALQVHAERFADVIPDRAEAYAWNGAANQRNWYLYPPYAYAAGGAYSSAKDLANFLIAVDGQTYLSAGSRGALWSPIRLDDGSPGEFGVGWVAGSYRGQRYGGHSGGPALADVLYFPDSRLGVAVLTNQKALAPVLASLIIDQIIAPPPGYFETDGPDDAPEHTIRARQLIEQMQQGAVAVELMAGDSTEQAGNLSRWGAGWVALFPPLSGVQLVSDEAQDNGGRFRRYRFIFGDHLQVIGVLTDFEGRIAGLGPEGDGS
jgi:CubicO group peptidase (beta-lactamase class C family)